MTNGRTENNLSQAKLDHIKKYLIGSSVLDAGGGYGNYSKWVIDNKPNINVICVDKLDLPNHDGINYISVDLENPIPFEDNSFDTVFAFDVIEYINNERSMIKEFYRVCKPGGIIIGSVPHDDDQFLPAYNLTYHHRSDTLHRHRYNPYSLNDALENGGFEDILIEAKGSISPRIIAEFFPRSLQFIVKKSVDVLHKISVVRTGVLASELFFIARKK